MWRVVGHGWKGVREGRVYVGTQELRMMEAESRGYRELDQVMLRYRSRYGDIGAFT